MAAEVKEYIPSVADKPHVKITSDKFKEHFLVLPTNDGFVFYQVVISKGLLPKELRGKYSRMKHAVDAVLRYEHKADKSQAVKRDEKAEERHAAKLQRERTEHIRAGADNGEG